MSLESSPMLTPEPQLPTYSPKSLKSRVLSVYNDTLLPNIGLVFIVLSQFFNSIMVMTTKLLETDPQFEEPIHPLQILFVRMSITSGGCYVYLKYYKKEKEIMGPKNLRWLLVARGLTGFIGVFSMYYSLMYLSVSDATVITFLVPSMTGFLAWVLLKERWSLMEAGGALVSLMGVVLIARPAFLFGVPDSPSGNPAESSDPKERLGATMMALFGVTGASMVYVVIRFIGKRVHSLVMVEYFAGITCIISLSGIIVVPGLAFKIPQTGKQWFLFFTLGISGFLMQFLLTEGIQREKASRASMMLYSQMVYALIWEITIWHHLPSFWSWLGITIILSAAYYVITHKPKDPKPMPLVDTETQARPYQDEFDELETIDD